MKTIVNLLNSIGLYTKEQYDTVAKEKKMLAESNKKLRMETNSNSFYIAELVKTQKSLPFEFDNLISMYTKDQINAFVYKAINHVRNNPNYRNLLGIWQKRIRNAKNTIKFNKEDLDVDPNFNRLSEKELKNLSDE